MVSSSHHTYFTDMYKFRVRNRLDTEVAHRLKMFLCSNVVQFDCAQFTYVIKKHLIKLQLKLEIQREATNKNKLII